MQKGCTHHPRLHLPARPTADDTQGHIQATAKNPSPFQLGRVWWSSLSQYLMPQHVSLICQIPHVLLSWLCSTSPCPCTEMNLQEPHSKLLEEFKHVGRLESCEGSCRGKRRIAQTAAPSGGWKSQGANHGQASALHRDNRGAELQGASFQTLLPYPGCWL